MSLMKHKNYSAKIEYDPEIDMFRGEILGLTGGADFYGKSLRELKSEFKKSLQSYLDVCAAKGIQPLKDYSGKFNVRLDKHLHCEIAESAAAENISLNQWVVKALEKSLANRH